MLPGESHEAFQRYVRDHALRLEVLRAREGARLMCEFFEAKSVSSVQADHGDMLLFQWGTYDWGAGMHFEIDITRQFIESALEDDDAISQLSLRFEFVPDDSLQPLEGNFWCMSHNQIGDFRAKVLAHPVLTAVDDRREELVRLSYEYV